MNIRRLVTIYCMALVFSLECIWAQDSNQAYLDRIAANPDDFSLKEEFADWLGSDPFGAILKIALKIYKIEMNRKSDATDFTKQKELQSQLEDMLIARDLTTPAMNSQKSTFGFSFQREIDEARFKAAFPIKLRYSPSLQTLKLCFFGGRRYIDISANEIYNEQLSQKYIRSLSLTSNSNQAQDHRVLEDISTVFPKLESLEITDDQSFQFTNQNLELLSRLKRLTLSNFGLIGGPELINFFADAPFHLEELNIQAGSLADDTLDQVLQQKSVRKVTSLRLDESTWSRIDRVPKWISALAKLSNLRKLTLSRSKFDLPYFKLNSTADQITFKHQLVTMMALISSISKTRVDDLHVESPLQLLTPEHWLRGLYASEKLAKNLHRIHIGYPFEGTEIFAEFQAHLANFILQRPKALRQLHIYPVNEFIDDDSTSMPIILSELPKHGHSYSWRFGKNSELANFISLVNPNLTCAKALDLRP